MWRWPAIAVLVALALPAAARAGEQEETLRLVRIATDDPFALESELASSGFDVMEGSVTAGTIDVVVTVDQLALLEARGLRLAVIERGRPLREKMDALAPPAGDGVIPVGYSDLDAIVAQMTQFAADHPTICQLVDLTTTFGAPATVEGRHLYAVKISDNVTQEEDEPTAIIVAAHHCREINTPVLALYAIDQITTFYGLLPTVTNIVNGYEIWIAPVWNPDGYEYVFNTDNLWRKNRRVFPLGTGVDLNRNYPFRWDQGCGGDSSPSSLTYHGPSAGSEAETQTMMAMSLDRHFAKVLDYHSYGQETLWGYLCATHPFDSWLESEALALTQASGYVDTREPSADSEHYEWQLSMQGAYAFLTEIGTQFQPTYASAQAEAQQVYPGIIHLLQRPIPLSGHVTDAVSGLPLEAAVTLPDVNFTEGETNASGGPFGRYYVFAPPGIYDVEFSADGYVAQTHTAMIGLDPSLVIDVALVPEGGIPGDLDGDGSVTFADLLQLLGFWGPCPPGPCPGDLDGDLQVGFSDLLVLLGNWG